MRRSSTSRSMGGLGVRSDYDASVNGDIDDEALSLVNSAPDNPEREHERNEANRHVANYVSEQLQRVRSHESLGFENGDEFEAQLDEPQSS